MTLADTAYLARRAAHAGHGLGAFNVVHLDQAVAYVAAAERAGSPIVLQLSHNAIRFVGRPAPLIAGLLVLAEEAHVPVAVHLDHIETAALVHEGAALGVRSVMFDASTLPPEQNVSATREVVEYCHERGIVVEAELGEIGGKNGVHDPSARTDPRDAAEFVAATGVDLLAVAVGSSHAMTTRGAQLDNELIGAIRAEVPVPLVLHGSSGVSDEGMVQAIAAGMTKINVATHLGTLFTQEARRRLGADESLRDTRTWMRPALDVAGNEVERLLRLYTAPTTASSTTDCSDTQATPA